MQKILVVEDDRELNRALCYALERNSYPAVSAFSLKEAKKIFEEEAFLLILLDVNLPDGEGFDFCRWVKSKRNIPVLFLTARDLEEDALMGYGLGAEDYVTKPFSMKILLKKIEIVLKHTKGENKLLFDDGFLKIDLEMAKIWVNGEDTNLTPTEFRLLREFIMNKGILLTYDVLLERLWEAGSQSVDRHALAVNMNRLRRKLEDTEHSYISNVYGMGYQWI